MRNKIEERSVLRFTHEIGVGRKLPFLDVSVDASSPSRHHMDRYRKNTNTGKCLNSMSQCPERYSKSVIGTFVRRTLKTCTTWEKDDTELKHVKRILTNNNFSSRDIDREINWAVDLANNKKKTNTAVGTGTTYAFFYKK